MARRRTNELIAGVFVLACAAILFVVAVWLGDVHWGGQKAYFTIPLSEGNAGIQKGSYVHLGLIRIGTVQDVRLRPDGKSFLVEALLEDGQVAYRDALVRAEAPPLGGGATLVLYSPGTSAAGTSSPNQPIPMFVGSSAIVKDLARETGFGEQQRTQFQQIIASLHNTACSMELISASLEKELGGGEDASILAQLKGTVGMLHGSASSIQSIVKSLQPEFDSANQAGALAKVHRSLDDVNRTTEDIQEFAQGARPQAEAMLSGAAETVEAMRQYTRADVAETLKNLRGASDELVGLMKDFHVVSGEAREMFLLNRENVDEIVANMAQASANLKGATREIRTAPWKLLGKPTVEDVRTENIQAAARAFADGATELDTALKRMQVLASLAEKPISADDPQLIEVRNGVKDAYLKFSQAEQALWKELAQ